MQERKKIPILKQNRSQCSSVALPWVFDAVEPFIMKLEIRARLLVGSPLDLLLESFTHVTTNQYNPPPRFSKNHPFLDEVKIVKSTRDRFSQKNLKVTMAKVKPLFQISHIGAVVKSLDVHQLIICLWP